MICFGTHRFVLRNHNSVRGYLLGDFHLGARAVEKDRIKQTVATIEQDDNCFVMLLGDLVEAISIDDKRFDPDAVDPDVVPIDKLFEIVSLEVDYASRLLEPIREKIVGSVAGNHEDTIYKRHGGFHPTAMIAKNLGLAYRTFTTQRAGWVNIVGQVQSSRISVPVLIHHGYGGGRTKGNTVNKLANWASQFPDARVVGMGHMHDPNVLSLPPYMRFRREKLHEQHTLLIAAGAFMRSYPEHRSYVEAGALPPKAMTCPHVELEFFRTGHSRQPGFKMRKEWNKHTASAICPGNRHQFWGQFVLFEPKHRST